MCKQYSQNVNPCLIDSRAWLLTMMSYPTFLNSGLALLKSTPLLCACQCSTALRAWVRRTSSPHRTDEVLFSPPLLQTVTLAFLPCYYDLLTSFTSNGSRIFLQRLNCIYFYLSAVKNLGELMCFKSSVGIKHLQVTERRRRGTMSGFLLLTGKT